MSRDAQAQAVWRELTAFATLVSDPAPARTSGASRDLLLRAGARPAALGMLIEACERHAPNGAAKLVGYGGVGLAHARWPLREDADATVVGRALAELRAALDDHNGSAL